MKILLFGSSGFVANHMKELIKSKTKWDIFESDKDCKNNKNYFQCDITNKNEVENVINVIKPDYVINFAAQSSVKKSWEDPVLTMTINTLGTINILESIKNNNINTKILLIGSVEEYGDPESKVIFENHNLNPKNIYAVSKVSQEMIAKTYIQAYNMHIILTRSSNHFGPGQSNQFVISDFSYQIANIIKSGFKNSIIETGNIDIKKDFSDVRDVVQAYLLLLEKGKAGETYNIASGESISIRLLLEKLIILSGRNIVINVNKNKFRPTEILNSEFSVEKIKNDVGWVSKYTIEDTLKDTLEYWLHLGEENI